MKREFTLFGFSHFIALSIITVLIVFILIKLQTIDPEKLKKRLNPLLAILILTQATIWRIVFLSQNDFSLTNDLPFHLCGISQVLMIIYLIKPNKKLFNILYYWIMSGSTLGIIIPDLKLDFPSARYFAMFLPHSLLIFTMLYLLLIQKKKPAKGSALYAFMVLNIYAVFLIPINLITKGNYLFLLEIPVVDFSPVEWLPEWPWYILVLVSKRPPWGNFLSWAVSFIIPAICSSSKTRNIRRSTEQVISSLTVPRRDVCNKNFCKLQLCK